MITIKNITVQKQNVLIPKLRDNYQIFIFKDMFFFGMSSRALDDNKRISALATNDIFETGLI